MKKNITMLILLVLFISCQTNTKGEIESIQEDIFKEETLSKSQLLTEDIQVLFKILNDEIVTSSFDSQGGFSIDLGSASTGRVKGNLKEVNLRFEFLPERPGCADVCPEMAIIHFECKGKSKCVEDAGIPELGKYTSGSLAFQNLEFGKSVYHLLQRIQENL